MPAIPDHQTKSELLALNLRLAEEIASREVIERQQSLQLKIADKLRGMVNSEEIARTAFDLLAAYVPASQMTYSEIDPSGAVFIIRHAWHRAGVSELVAHRGQTADFGHAIMASLHCAIPVTISDTDSDPRTAPHAASYAAFKTRSCLIMPIVKAGRLAAIFTLHQSAPYDWALHYSLLIEDIADRVWNAMELAAAQLRHTVSEQARTFERRAETERLKSLFAQAPGFMVIFRGAGHVFEFVNAAFTRMIGERELLDLPVRAALPELAGQGFVELLDEAYRSGLPRPSYDVQLRIRRHPGQGVAYTYVDFVCQPIINALGDVTGIFVEGSDATERHVAKRALEAAQARLDEGMSAGRMAIWDWELGTARILFSQNTTEVFGRPLTSVADVWEAVYEEDLERLHLAGERALHSGGTYEEVVRIRRIDSAAPLWIQIHGKFLLGPQGVPHTVRCVAIDVTSLKLAQGALQDADRRKDEFLAMLAHELRNPLAPIRSGAQVLGLVHGDSVQVQRIAAVIGRQAVHMTSLINDLLDVSRVTSGLVTLDRQRQLLADVLRDSIEQVTPMMEERRHSLVYAKSGDEGVVMGDHKRLVQVFTNLLQNAAKYTSDGGEIVIRVTRVDDDLAVSVSDNGAGMTAELLPRVFELFTQERQTPDRSQGGLGLGLTLVQRIVKLHHGIVTAESDGVGKGACFTVYLPMAPASDMQGVA